MMFLITLGIVWLINQRRSTKINVYKTRKIIINGIITKRKSSKIINKEIINVWNENQHGERQLSIMIITKRKSSYSRWNEQGIVSGMKKWRV
jgi:hypothetical protein